MKVVSPVLLLACLLALSTPAMAGDGVAGQVRYQGGECSLQEAVALLAASGNATTLTLDADHARRGYLQPLAHDYWQAVLIVCEVFELRLLPPRQFRVHQHFTPAAPVEMAVIETGPVQLSPKIPELEAELPEHAGGLELARYLNRNSRDRAGTEDREPAQRRAIGPILLEILDAAIASTWTPMGHWSHCGVALRLRAEPRFDYQHLGPSTIHWQRAITPTGVELSIDRSHLPPIGLQHRQTELTTVDHRPPPQVVLLRHVPTDLQSFALDGRLAVRLTAPNTDHLRLRPGQQLRVLHEGRELQLGLWSDAQARQQKLPGGGLELRHIDTTNNPLPAVIVKDPAGSILVASGYDEGNHQGLARRIVYLPGLKAGQEYQIFIRNVVRIDDLDLTFSLPLRLPNGRSESEE